MEMVKLNDMKDYESLPMTKWKIKQPNVDDDRENAMENGKCHKVTIFFIIILQCFSIYSSIGFNLNAWSSFH